jgi:hypothetical protein
MPGFPSLGVAGRTSGGAPVVVVAGSSAWI